MDLQKWNNVLLTDAGFHNPRNLDQPLTAHIERFSKMLGKPFSQAKVLFIPTASRYEGGNNEEARNIASVLKDGLFRIGILSENLIEHDIDGTLTEDEAMRFDVIYFTGGWDGHLLRCIKDTGFEKIIYKMVYANKVYVGVSAGTVIATPNIGGCFGSPYNEETTGLRLINAYIDCHCNFKPDLKQLDLPLPHIMLCDHQALAVSSEGYELIEELSAIFDT